MVDTSSRRRPAPRPLAHVLAESREQLAHAVLVALVDEIGGYAALPPEALDGDIIDNARMNIGRFVEALTTGSMPDDAALQEIRDSAARRAEEGVPLEVLLTGYALAARVIHEHVGPVADPDDLRTVTSRVYDYLGVATAAAAAGYLEEHQLIHGAAQEQEERVLDALLAGRDLAEADNDRVPGRVVDVVRFAIGPHADETEPGIDARIAARRKLRRFRAELRRRAPEALASLATDGGVAVVPVPPPEAEGGAGAAEGGCTSALVEALAGTSGVAVTAACQRAEPAHVPEAVTIAGEMLDLVGRLGRPPGVYRLDDLVPAYQLTRPGPARDALVRILAPLGGRPELRATLRRYLETGRNRRHAALDLGIHVNTVDYRIAKVAELTGLDPLDPTDGHRLHAALVAVPD